MAEFLKRAQALPAHAREEVRETVSAMLLDIERRGEAAVRDWSLRLDGWAPDSFLVSEAEVGEASASLTDELKAHIAFAQEQVRRFAEHQRATLAELDVETLPGVRLGHRHVPVDAVARTCRVVATRWSRRRS